jgi:hypothetical protein
MLPWKHELLTKLKTGEYVPWYFNDWVDYPDHERENFLSALGNVGLITKQTGQNPARNEVAFAAYCPICVKRWRDREFMHCMNNPGEYSKYAVTHGWVHSQPVNPYGGIWNLGKTTS